MQRKDEPARLPRMTQRITRALDGSENRLEGVFEEGRATGSVRTRTGTGWFAAAAHGDGVRLLLAARDPRTSGEADLTDGWQLDFTRVVDAAADAAAAPAPGMRPAAAGAATATPLVQQWTEHLAGRKVSFIESYASGGSGFSDRWEAYLCTDGSFHFRSGSSMSADVGGVFGGGNSADSFSGRWRLVEQAGRALLQYQRTELAGTARVPGGEHVRREVPRHYAARADHRYFAAAVSFAGSVCR